MSIHFLFFPVSIHIPVTGVCYDCPATLGPDLDFLFAFCLRTFGDSAGARRGFFNFTVRFREVLTPSVADGSSDD